ncbi:Phospholipase_D-nuclease N-terminal [Streptomyces sp. 2224.1]|uniref:SHOCT domain-containing protein n=1 Tax=unclassified Streptomyces TaxID=2593676 RepID=UPI00088BF4D2|nr:MULTISPECIES: SHOCT domain-containing protein [unclassified Streptomyces]PBC86803.1 phospholipase D-like protein [Streptomyces sp. 2321.6]SDQ71915.1 Phospholipase_D-nuclease N-terminal [Streptomyces sp. KS_16]SED43707.1 Phospholipase_D-nuclease N-terminal [Streptomyces sp. 2112.3]SED81343.1 Phospholipase_D-nuclease N-terminal [Streptomyces sp. 2224.1]SEE09906.1 Phospholipase_D-nuclease N-terminal [Streptomyces sp. 2133.1]
MDYPLLNAFWTMCLIFLWVLWLILLFRIIGDIFRSQDLGNWGKTGWLVLVIVLPFLGVFIYVIARGHGMSEREVAQAERQQKQLRAYLRDTAATGDEAGGHADALAKLADLKNHGDITEEEFQKAKAKILA